MQPTQRQIGSQRRAQKHRQAQHSNGCSDAMTRTSRRCVVSLSASVSCAGALTTSPRASASRRAAYSSRSLLCRASDCNHLRLFLPALIADATSCKRWVHPYTELR